MGKLNHTVWPALSKTASYVIGWESKTRGLRDQGTAQYSYTTAKDICEKTDAEYPEIEHFPVLVEVAPDDDIQTNHCHLKL